MNNLTETDYQNHEARFITRQIAADAKLRRVTDTEGAEIVGRKPKAGVSYSGVLYGSYLPFDYNNPREYRLRRDQPDLERQSDGTIKEGQKYLSPPGARNMLYFPPYIAPEMMKDTSLPIVITEAGKNTLALMNLATSGNEGRPRFMPVGMNGCWGFRGVVAKVKNEGGANQSVKGTIPDFDLINWKGRPVYIALDVDVKTNPKVKQAEKALAKSLTQYGAEVYLIELPDLENASGIDDVLGYWQAQYGTETAVRNGLQLIESAKSFADTYKSQTLVEKVIELSDDLEFFHTANLETFAIIKVDSHIENIKIHSKEFRAYISRLCWVKEGKAISGQSLQDVINVLHSKALFESPKEETFIRYASHNGDIYIDLGNETWQCVKISPDGWEILESNNVPVRFRRTRGLLPLPLPSKVEPEAYRALFKFINIKEEDFILLCAWIVAAMRPDFPCPVLALYGGQGCGKSTTTEILRNLIDPNISVLRSKPKDERDLMIAARNSWVLSFDNLSVISHEFSDSLCRMVTGGGFAVRELYSDDSETIFEAKRPVIINGISELANRSDLLERCLLITLPTISDIDRKDEKTFRSELAEVKPLLFASFLDKLSEALSKIDNVQLPRLPRMADFAKFAYAAFGQEFLDRYDKNRNDANETALENSPIAETLLKLLENQTSDEWSGTANELLEALENIAEERTKTAKGFPKQAKQLSEMLKRIEPNLNAFGWSLTRHRLPRKRILTFNKVVNSASSASSASSPDVSGFNFNNLDNDAHNDAEFTDDAPMTQSDSSMTHDDADEKTLRHSVNTTKHITYESDIDTDDADDAEHHTFSNGRDYSNDNDREVLKYDAGRNHPQRLSKYRRQHLR